MQARQAGACAGVACAIEPAAMPPLLPAAGLRRVRCATTLHSHTTALTALVAALGPALGASAPTPLLNVRDSSYLITLRLYATPHVHRLAHLDPPGRAASTLPVVWRARVECGGPGKAQRRLSSGPQHARNAPATRSPNNANLP